MIQIKNRTYKGQTVGLDGCEYIRCTFIDCTIKWNGRPYKFGAGTSFGGLTAFITDNAKIADVVSLLKAFHMLEPEFSESWQRVTPHFVPTIRKAS